MPKTLRCDLAKLLVDVTLTGGAVVMPRRKVGIIRESEARRWLVGIRTGAAKN